MTEIGLTTRARLIGGARYENDQLTVNALLDAGIPVVDAQKHWNDVLPSLALNIQLDRRTSSCVCRRAETLARPEYRELAPIRAATCLNGDDTQGNDNSQRTNVSNADLRWEWYPRSGEVLSFGVFAKQFDQPDRARVPGRRLGNARRCSTRTPKSATNYGVEVGGAKESRVPRPVARSVFRRSRTSR